MDQETPVVANPETAATATAPEAAASVAATTTSLGTSPAQVASTPVAVATTNSVTDMLRDVGVDVSQYGGDERAALQALAQARQQYQQVQAYQPHLQQIIPHWPEIQKLIADKQRASAQTQPGAEKPWYAQWWNPPEFDQAQLSQLKVDEQGNVVALPGAPPDLPAKFANYNAYRSAQMQKLQNNPLEFMEPAIRHLAKQVADEHIGQHMQSYRDSVFANNFQEQHSHWLHERDANGQVALQAIVDQRTGQVRQAPALSRYGSIFKQAVMTAERMGITNVQDQANYALQAVQLDAARQLQGQQQQGANGDAAKQAFLQKAAAAHNPSQNGAVTQTNGNAMTPTTKLSLRDRLKADMAAAGVTDMQLQGTGR